MKYAIIICIVGFVWNAESKPVDDVQTSLLDNILQSGLSPIMKATYFFADYVTESLLEKIIEDFTFHYVDGYLPEKAKTQIRELSKQMVSKFLEYLHT